MGDLDHHLEHGSLGLHESDLQTASGISSAHPSAKHTHAETTLLVTSVAIDRIVHVMRPKTEQFFSGLTPQIPWTVTHTSEHIHFYILVLFSTF